MISRETENVQSSSEVEQAFRALTSGEKPYITAQELYAVSLAPSPLPPRPPLVFYFHLSVCVYVCMSLVSDSLETIEVVNIQTWHGDCLSYKECITCSLY